MVKKVHSAGIVLYRVRLDGIVEYLLLHYPHGHWDLVKGKIEGGESVREAALRELKEETELEATIHDGFIHEISFYFNDNEGRASHKTVTFLVGRAHEGHVQLSHEHIDYAWQPIDKALTMLTFQGAKEVVQAADFFIQNLLKTPYLNC